MFGLPEITVSMHGYAAAGAVTARERIEAIAALGVRGIVLDAGTPGLRARELGRSARRDVASVLRRAELELGGLDLWIPPEHFSGQETSERAIEAAGRALALAAELSGLIGGRSRALVSVELPLDLDAGVRAALGAEAQRSGAVLADHAIVPKEASGQGGVVEGIGIGIGIDPVAQLRAGCSAGKAVTRAGDRLASARLGDTNAMGRCVLGSQGGKLDLRGYAGALIVSGQQWVTLDVRDLPEPDAAVRRGVEVWRDAGTI